MKKTKPIILLLLSSLLLFFACEDQDSYDFDAEDKSARSGDGCNLRVNHGNYCSDPACGPCGEGEGDCDRDSDCRGELVCRSEENGGDPAQPGHDVCVRPGSDNDDNGDNCDGKCSPSCPCDVDEGDCDRDADCKSGLYCPQVDGHDVCKEEGGDCHSGSPGSSSYCRTACPCGEGEGDCDKDSHCKGDLVCKQQSGTDFCVQPDDDDDDDPSQGRKSYSGLWGGKHVKLRDVWEKNWIEGLSLSEKYLLVSNNDCSQSRVKERAQANGFRFIAQEGSDDSGATLLQVQGNSNKDGLKAILNVGKITITAVTTSGTLIPEGGGGDNQHDSTRMAFGSTDNTNTGGGVYHLDINANEDGVTIWDREHPCKSFRGGFMNLRWN